MQRLEDAGILLQLDRTTGAVYLAGYAVECMLKALALNQCPPSKRGRLNESFRGAKAHNFEWLGTRYLELGGSTFPSAIAKAFSLVSTWEVSFRYRGGAIQLPEAKAFIDAARTITQWADERMRDMGVTIQGKSDKITNDFAKILGLYQAKHPHARIECYRSDPASIRVRIIDPSFEGVDRVTRHEDVWRWLERLPEPTQSHLSWLILVTPEEAKTSFASHEFDKPLSLTS